MLPRLLFCKHQAQVDSFVSRGCCSSSRGNPRSEITRVTEAAATKLKELKMKEAPLRKKVDA